MNKIESISDRLKIALAQSGMKQTELADAVGTSRTNICRYVKGEIEPRGEKLYRMSLVLGVDLGWLSGLDVPMLPETAEHKITREKIKTIILNASQENLEKIYQYCLDIKA